MTLFNFFPSEDFQSNQIRIEERNKQLNILPFDLNAINKSGRIMAIDAGTKRMGIAICDQDRLIATPKMVMKRVNNEKDFTKISDFINENKVEIIVIGRPFKMNGDDYEMTILSEKFGYQLDIFLQKKLPIIFFEERLTTYEAREINRSDLSRKKNQFVDDIAASLILKHFMDSIHIN